MVVNGRRFDTSGASQSGSRWQPRCARRRATSSATRRALGARRCSVAAAGPSRAGSIASAMTDAAPTRPSSAATPGRSSAETTRLAVALVAGALIAVFAVLNTDEVEVNWIIGTAKTPLIIVIVVSLAGRRGASATSSRAAGPSASAAVADRSDGAGPAGPLEAERRLRRRIEPRALPRGAGAERGLHFEPRDYESSGAGRSTTSRPSGRRSGSTSTSRPTATRRVLASREMPGARWFPDVALNHAEHVFRGAATATSRSSQPASAASRTRSPGASCAR